MTTTEFWVALALAIGAAVLMEIVKAMLHRYQKTLPFLILKLARLTLPKDTRAVLYDEVWAPELLHELGEGEGHPVRRFFHCLAYSASLLFTGRRTALEESGQPLLRRRLVVGFRLLPWRDRRRAITILLFAPLQVGMSIVGYVTHTPVLGVGESDALTYMFYLSMLGICWVMVDMIIRRMLLLEKQQRAELRAELAFNQSPDG